jgi:hypothetical protein
MTVSSRRGVGVNGTVEEKGCAPKRSSALRGFGTEPHRELGCPAPLDKEIQHVEEELQCRHLALPLKKIQN